MCENTENMKMPERKAECNGFCPVCGSDLAFLGDECICKNRECSWHCTDCKTEEDSDFKI